MYGDVKKLVVLLKKKESCVSLATEIEGDKIPHRPAVAAVASVRQGLRTKRPNSASFRKSKTNTNSTTATNHSSRLNFMNELLERRKKNQPTETLVQPTSVYEFKVASGICKSKKQSARSKIINVAALLEDKTVVETKRPLHQEADSTFKARKTSPKRVPLEVSQAHVGVLDIDNTSTTTSIKHQLDLSGLMKKVSLVGSKTSTTSIQKRVKKKKKGNNVRPKTFRKQRLAVTRPPSSSAGKRLSKSGEKTTPRKRRGSSISKRRPSSAAAPSSKRKSSGFKTVVLTTEKPAITPVCMFKRNTAKATTIKVEIDQRKQSLLEKNYSQSSFELSGWDTEM